MTDLVGSAVISEDGRYRYSLTRQLKAEPGPRLVIIGLNPSTADAFKDDNTIRREVAFGLSWGCSILEKLNVYGYRTTFPVELKPLCEMTRTGPLNDAHIKAAIAAAKPGDIYLAAWGAFEFGAAALARIQAITDYAFLHDVRFECLGKNANGSPKHPLYLKKTAARIPYP